MSNKEADIIKGILSEARLKESSEIYRFTSIKHLSQDENGRYLLKVNQNPVDMIVDTYQGQGHTFIAREIGQGLSFLKEPLEEYIREDRICVSTTIGDLLSVGGKIYKVSSLPAYISAYFFSLPVNQVYVEKIT